MSHSASVKKGALAVFACILLMLFFVSNAPRSRHEHARAARAFDVDTVLQLPIQTTTTAVQTTTTAAQTTTTAAQTTTTAAQTTPTTSSDRRALVCIFGVFARSLTQTHVAMRQHVLGPLALANFKTDVYFFDIQIPQGGLLDGVAVNEEASFTQGVALKLEQRNSVYDSVMQGPAFDEIIQSRCSKLPSCRLRYDIAEGHPEVTRNALQAMYAEAQVARHIRASGGVYDLVVAFTSDAQFVQDLPVQQPAENIILLTDLNEGEGYTNGFYMGAPSAVAAVMGRFDEYELYAMLERDYELVVKAAVDHHRLIRGTINMPFCKIRRSGQVWWGPNFPYAMVAKCYPEPNASHMQQ